jgi:phosphotransferase system enzyme I (PtsI)
MTQRDPRNFCLRGIAVSGGIAIGRAVLIASSRVGVAHDFIAPDQVGAELERLGRASAAAVAELQRLRRDVPRDAPVELAALLDVHLMLLEDEDLGAAMRQWIRERLYNAEWAVTTQLEIIARQFDVMEDEYLRERKADLEQVIERMLRHLKGDAAPAVAPPPARRAPRQTEQLLLANTQDAPLVLVAHDLSPADMLQFKKSVFAGFVTDVGGKTSHTAIVARSMNIPAVVGARATSQLVRQDDWVVIDGDAGVIVVNPSPIILAEYGFKQRQGELERGRLTRLRNTPSVTLDGQRIELLANIEQPGDTEAALAEIGRAHV